MSSLPLVERKSGQTSTSRRPYMRHVLGFIGIHDVTVIAAGQSDDQMTAPKTKARSDIAEHRGVTSVGPLIDGMCNMRRSCCRDCYPVAGTLSSALVCDLNPVSKQVENRDVTNRKVA